MGAGDHEGLQVPGRRRFVGRAVDDQVVVSLGRTSGAQHADAIDFAGGDRRGDLLKTLTLGDYQNYNGVWRSQRMEMVNHQTGKSTDFIYGDYRFDVGLDEGDFVKGRLARLR